MTLPRSERRPVVAAALAALAVSPDLDLAGFVLGIPYSNLLGHRGLFHSLVLAACVALMIAVVLAQTRIRGRVHPMRVVAGCFAAMGSHGVLDAMTNGGMGVGLLQPVVDGRFFLPWRPIEVAAIHPSRFLVDATTVLLSEITSVWLPLAAVVGGVLILERWRDSKPGSTGAGARISAAEPDGRPGL